MLQLKDCPRCGGDIQINSDMYGDYRQCLQCGHIQDIEKKNEFIKELIAGSKKKEAA